MVAPDSVVELTVEDVQEGLARGRFTAAELTRAFLDRIERYEERYNAFVSLNPAAPDSAAALDREYRLRGPRGPLHGVPVVVKDNMDVAGLVTTAGFSGFSRATDGVDLVPGDDAAVVERLRKAGAVILGKTNLPDFAGHGTRTESSVAGVTLNPYAVDRVPGGSSGGTATAVNASFAVLGLGTETGGSIQNPAAAQALVGVKPTYGLVPLEGIVPMNATYVDVVGPLARTVRDAALALDVIAGPTTEDLATFAGADHIPVGGYATVLSDTALAGHRFGLVGPGWRDSFLPLAPETEALYRDAVEVLEARGAEVVEDPFRGRGFVELYDERPRVPSQGAHDLLLYFRGLGPEAAFHSIEEWEELTGEAFPGWRRRSNPARPSATEEGDAFQAWRLQIRGLFRRVLEEHDLDGLFFPQAGAPIGKLVEDPARPDYSPNNHPELPSNIVNQMGLPVVTVPFAFYDDGTPFVVVFIGDTWTEADLLAWAYALERATRARRPPVLERE
jgi:Asp-tRNA(Asn)/Glu-tRNA(Gln) amidotransferase A subunit family amidase